MSSTVLRTWALRGAAAFVLVLLVGAWAVGLARNGDDDGPARDETAPAAPDSSLAPVAEPTPDSIASEPSTTASDSGEPSETSTTSAAAEDSPDTVPVVDRPDDPDRAGPPTPASTPRPSDRPTPRPTPSPTPTPTNPPTQDCVELLDALNCVLAPITSRP
ncbi:hypothetical protein ACFQ0K_16825 [Nocardioides caeni]|uniref:hypothetical protein n=1 Tax=Nocardioides caeni TaxID=574700 RepID=UPI0018735DCA|nr:hypothetical protein [Nocardioides caeni]